MLNLQRSDSRSIDHRKALNQKASYWLSVTVLGNRSVRSSNLELQEPQELRLLRYRPVQIRSALMEALSYLWHSVCADGGLVAFPKFIALSLSADSERICALCEHVSLTGSGCAFSILSECLAFGI